MAMHTFLKQLSSVKHPRAFGPINLRLAAIFFSLIFRWRDMFRFNVAIRESFGGSLDGELGVLEISPEAELEFLRSDIS
jgi:hypothetical protein